MVIDPDNSAGKEEQDLQDCIDKQDKRSVSDSESFFSYSLAIQSSAEKTAAFQSPMRPTCSPEHGKNLTRSSKEEQD